MRHVVIEVHIESCNGTLRMQESFFRLRRSGEIKRTAKSAIKEKKNRNQECAGNSYMDKELVVVEH